MNVGAGGGGIKCSTGLLDAVVSWQNIGWLVDWCLKALSAQTGYIMP